MPDWLLELPTVSPVGHALGLVALVCAMGMALGSIKVRGIGLGSAGALFMGILAAQFSRPIEIHTLHFIKEFGLVLFVFAIGLQLGPGFFASLRSDGMRWNGLAVAVIALGGALSVLMGWLLGLEPAAIGGLFAGASTNVPALGAAQQTLATIPHVDPQQLALPALACAVSYPAAIAGVLITIVAIKGWYRIDPIREAEQYAAQRRPAMEPVQRRTIVVDNPQLRGLTPAELFSQFGDGVVVSRMRPVEVGQVQTGRYTQPLQLGDLLLTVGTETRLDQFQQLVGRRAEEDLMLAPGAVSSRRIAVTNQRVLNKTMTELMLEERFEVKVTRITRGDLEMTAVPSLQLQFGDVVQVVGAADQLDQSADFLGNSVRQLNETQFIPLFIGIALGVLVGSIPIAVPGLPFPLKLGLAGGPLIVALVLARIGHIGRLVWHMPLSANHAFREFGVALFFAALGLLAGDQFFATVCSPRGLIWLAAGVLIAVVPLVAVGVWARSVRGMSFVTLGGILAGSMTNPPALTFVNNLCRSDAPTLAYAAVYPLTTLLRIVVAQLLALLVAT